MMKQKLCALKHLGEALVDVYLYQQRGNLGLHVCMRSHVTYVNKQVALTTTFLVNVDFVFVN
jgi:hypothetical protein